MGVYSHLSPSYEVRWNMPIFRKRPVEVEAWQWMGSSVEGWETFCSRIGLPAGQQTAAIPTLEGEMRVADGDYIIRGVCGEYYPCKAHIFEMTYEPVEPSVTLDVGVVSY